MTILLEKLLTTKKRSQNVLLFLKEDVYAKANK